MQSFLQKQLKKFETEDDNYSRLVTKCRFDIKINNSFLMTEFQV